MMLPPAKEPNTLMRPIHVFALIGRVSFLALLLAATSCNSNPTSPSTSSAPYSQTDLVVGTGTQAIVGNLLTVTYTGWLYDSGKTDGKGPSSMRQRISRLS
jgi:hypothetical protein